ncbi:MAG TPA: alpha/beta hydrolase [Acidimicrobiales bacterium]
MTSYVNSADGTRIAHDRLGSGPPLVLVSGMFCHRPVTQPLASALAGDFDVVHYDRRGRGESTDVAPYAVEREIEDLAELIAVLGGSAAVYGHSSGAGLALEAAAAGLPITRLVLHEPPYSEDDADSRAASRSMAADILRALDEDRRGDAITRFLGDGAPAADPGMLAVAPTMRYDLLVMGMPDGGAIPEAKARSIAAPTLVLAGAESPAFFRTIATRLASLIPGATREELPAADHSAPASVVAPAVTRFLVTPTELG